MQIFVSEMQKSLIITRFISLYFQQINITSLKVVVINGILTFLMNFDVLTRIHRTVSRISVAFESGSQVSDSLRLFDFI